LYANGSPQGTIMIRDERLSMRIKTELRRLLVIEAKSQDRSVAYVVEKILQNHFDARPNAHREARPVPKPNAR
jgi:hypothetical protein